MKINIVILTLILLLNFNSKAETKSTFIIKKETITEVDIIKDAIGTKKDNSKILFIVIISNVLPMVLMLTVMPLRRK